MTQDDVIRMAREAHKKLVTQVYVGHMGKLDPWMMEFSYIFAKLVAAHEREACAQIAERLSDIDLEHNFSALIAHNIRARGEQA